MGSSSPDLMRSRDDSKRGLSSRVGFLLAQLGTHRHRRFAERLAPLDLHPRHFGIISHLAANEGQSQQALSRTLGLHRSAMVALVDDLEDRGLAERRRDPVDRRAYALYLTAGGRELLVELERAADDDEAELLTDLDPSERNTLVSLLQRLAESQGLTAGVHPHLDPRDDGIPATLSNTEPGNAPTRQKLR